MERRWVDVTPDKTLGSKEQGGGVTFGHTISAKH